MVDVRLGSKYASETPSHNYHKTFSFIWLGKLLEKQLSGDIL